MIKKNNFKDKFKNLIDFLLKNRVKKIILLSSVSVYGSSNRIFNEKSSTNIKSKYSKFCKISEDICLNKDSEKIVIIRVANLFGNRRDKPSFIEKIILNNYYKKI